MEEMRELNPEELDQVSGGVWREVNTGIPNKNAKLRNGPSMEGTSQIASLKNGTMVDTMTDELVYDPASGRNFVQVTVNGKTGWIAASIIGMPR